MYVYLQCVPLRAVCKTRNYHKSHVYTLEYLFPRELWNQACYHVGQANYDAALSRLLLTSKYFTWFLRTRA